MQSRLIVKNIPKVITEGELKELFKSKGEVTDVKIIFKDKVNRRFCFIGYKKEESAKEA
jgi:multiple RNA-binding domain-containing protein 1